MTTKSAPVVGSRDPGRVGDEGPGGRQAAGTVAGLLRLYPEVRRGNLARAAYLAVQTVESLTHRFAAHPNHGLSRRALATELVAMLGAYLASEADRSD